MNDDNNYILTMAQTEFPKVFYANWTYLFSDDEMAEVPHRHAETSECKFTKTDDGLFYTSKLVLDHDDPYYQHFNSMEYGIKSGFKIQEQIGNNSELFSFFFAIARELPPSDLEKCDNGSSYETVIYIQTLDNEYATIPFYYDYVQCKNKKIFTGYHVEIPTNIIESFITNHRNKKYQLSHGL